jgi:hypothetical protein
VTSHALGRPSVDTAALRRTLVFVLVVLLALALLTTLGGEQRTPSPIYDAWPAEHGIRAWVMVNRADVFHGAEGPYVGSCPSASDPGVTGLCSSFVEDLGRLRIYTVGVYATDWGADLLLERSNAAWTVIDSEPWPVLGTPGAFGPPWSPQTAIAAWWSSRSGGSFGADAVHISSCDDAGAVATGQPVLCSTLREDRGDVRVYDSGLVGETPEVRIVLEQQPDHTWKVIGSSPGRT